MRQKRIIALTGGAGSGKSRILEVLKEKYGAAVLQTDLVAKELEEPGKPGYEALVKEFGDQILAGTGRLCSGGFLLQVICESKNIDETVVASRIDPLVGHQEIFHGFGQRDLLQLVYKNRYAFTDCPFYFAKNMGRVVGVFRHQQNHSDGVVDPVKQLFSILAAGTDIPRCNKTFAAVSFQRFAYIGSGFGIR